MGIPGLLPLLGFGKAKTCAITCRLGETRTAALEVHGIFHNVIRESAQSDHARGQMLCRHVRGEGPLGAAFIELFAGLCFDALLDYLHVFHHLHLVFEGSLLFKSKKNEEREKTCTVAFENAEWGAASNVPDCVVRRVIAMAGKHKQLTVALATGEAETVVCF